MTNESNTVTGQSRTYGKRVIVSRGGVVRYVRGQVDKKRHSNSVYITAHEECIEHYEGQLSFRFSGSFLIKIFIDDLNAPFLSRPFS